MKANIHNPYSLKYHPINPGGGWNIAAGGAGWVDTDVSATLGTDARRLYLIGSTCATEQLQGVRANGETAEPRWQCISGNHLAYLSPTGHFDFYRNAANDTLYFFLGYFDA